MTLNEERKSDLQKQLESEGWRFITNLSLSSEDYNIYENLEQKYGWNNVHMDKAYDIHGAALPSMRAVYIRETTLAEIEMKRQAKLN